MKEIPSPKYSLQNEILEINKKVTERNRDNRTPTEGDMARNCHHYLLTG